MSPRGGDRRMHEDRVGDPDPPAERNAGTLCDDSPRAMLDVTYTAPNTEPVKVTVELDSDELREWAGRLAVSGAVGPATVLYDAARSIEETGEVRPPAVVDEHYPEEHARAVAEEHARRSSLHDVRHGATIMSTGHHGCWFVCLCGVKGDPRWRTEVGASIDWAAHLAEATR